MDRIHISIPGTLRKQIVLRAQREQKPVAEVIRNLLEKGIEAKPVGDAGGALLAIANKAVKGAPPDLSENIDKYLYDE